MMLKRLVESHRKVPGIEIYVISLTDIGKVGKQIQELGINVEALGMRSAFHIPLVILNLIYKIRSIKPSIVQTWMYHSDLLGGIAAYVSGHPCLFWGIRGSDIPQNSFSATSKIIKLCSKFSYILPAKIICCANAAKISHIKKGYDSGKMVVIQNGYDLSKFQTSHDLKESARQAFGFRKDELVIGVVGRFDPLKDYRNFISAAAILSSKVKNVRFLMIGRDLNLSNPTLLEWLNEFNVLDKFVLLGERGDIEFCFAGMDIFCLSSSKEGFPNVVCEAMAMRLPTIVTDCGDAAEIVTGAGIVVPVNDSEKLAAALHDVTKMTSMERSALGEISRIRVETYYSMKKSSDRFLGLYETFLDKD